MHLYLLLLPLCTKVRKILHIYTLEVINWSVVHWFGRSLGLRHSTWLSVVSVMGPCSFMTLHHVKRLSFIIIIIIIIIIIVVIVIRWHRSNRFRLLWHVTIVWSVHLYVCMSSVTLVHPGKAIEQNEMPFGMDTRAVPCNIVLDSGTDPP